MVIRGCCEKDTSSNKKIAGSAPTSLPTTRTTSECVCVLDQLDRIATKALRSPATTPPFIRELLFRRRGVSNGKKEMEYHAGAENATTATTSSSSSSEFLTFRAYEALLVLALSSDGSFERREENPTSVVGLVAKGNKLAVALIPQILDTIAPFRDAIQTLLEATYPTIGLAIPILSKRTRCPLPATCGTTRRTGESERDCQH